MMRINHNISILFGALLVLWALAAPSYAAGSGDGGANSVYVPLNRSTLVTLGLPASEVMVADPDIADVHVHNPTHVTVVAKGLGRTSIRVLDKGHNVIRELEVVVGYDLPAIRKALKNFLPEETIGVEMVNSGIALTGKVRSAAAVDKALKIASDFVQTSGAVASAPAAQAPATPVGNNQNGGNAAAPSAQGAPSSAGGQASDPHILNFLQVISGQQVMLRVRVGEIQRSALKNLGVDLSGGISNGFQFATGVPALAGLLPPATTSTAVSSNVTYGPGHLLFPADSNGAPINTQGLLSGTISKNRNTLTGALQALEQDGLFKLLAEPNLVAVSGEQAEFLAGGEIPVPVPQGGGSGGGGTTISISYKPYGVAVRFKPLVLTESRIHMEVEPEVSELDAGNAVTIDNIKVPALTTRRAKTTVELAPGEGFMIAGLLKDQTDATISQLPGVMDMPILGALFRSTQFQRNETELVIAVTPYVVEPQKSSDIKMPTDDFRPANQMEMFFYGALGALPKSDGATKTKGLEGPTGFMVD